MTKSKIVNDIQDGKKVTDKELMKWANIFGNNYMVQLFVEGKICLTNEQLKMLVPAEKESRND